MIESKEREKMLMAEYKIIEDKIFAGEDQIPYHKARIMEHGQSQKNDLLQRKRSQMQIRSIEKKADHDATQKIVSLDMEERQKERERRAYVQQMMKEALEKQTEINEEKKRLVKEGYLY